MAAAPRESVTRLDSPDDPASECYSRRVLVEAVQSRSEPLKELGEEIVHQGDVDLSVLVVG